jgi:hypothetical protein
VPSTATILVIGKLTGVGLIVFAFIEPVAVVNANVPPPEVAEIVNVVAVGMLVT